MKIFLSHASKNKELVRAFQSHLPKHIHTWLDENELVSGMGLSVSIEEAIAKHCDFVVVFVGHDSQQSEWVQREVQWSLQKGLELGRVFLLPVLLENMWSEVNPPELRNLLYATCFDHSEYGIERSAKRFLDGLFSYLSHYFEGLRVSPKLHCYKEIEQDIVTYKELAYQLKATFGDSIAVISTTPAALDALNKAIVKYSEFSTHFMQRMAEFPEKIRRYWNSNNLADEARDLFNCIETEAYRGRIFQLNKVRENIVICTDDIERGKQDIEVLDQEKDAILADVGVVLKRINDDSIRLLKAMDKDIQR